MNFAPIRSYGLAVAALVAMFYGGVCASKVYSAPGLPKSGQFDQVTSITSPRLTFKLTDSVTFKGTRLRLESADPETGLAYQEIEDGQSYYRYLPTQQAALRIPLNGKQVSPLEQLQAQTTQKLAGTQKTGEAKANGFDCDVYSRDLGGGDKVVLYLSKDPDFPYIVKTVQTSPDQGLTRINSIENVKLDVPVNDDEFMLPKDTKIIQQPVGAGAGSASAGGSPPPQ